ncbi:leucine-rich repeat domain-containing protein [Emticicia fontis]
MSELAVRLIEENKKTKNPFLDLGNCNLKNTLPPQLWDCQWLENLNLGVQYHDSSTGTRLTTKNINSPNRFNGDELKDLIKLPKLTSLHFSDCQIEDCSFLEKLIDKEHFTHLDLSNNLIREMTLSLRPSYLTFLDLSYNQIQKLYFLEKAPLLTNLNLSANKIRDLDYIQKPNQLSNLNLSKNLIENIGYLQRLTQLEHLNLYNNRIDNISSLKKLNRLKTLDLSNNQIQEISSLEKLPQLESLDISHNEIQSASALHGIASLVNLRINSNPFVDRYSLNLPSFDNHLEIVMNILNREKEKTYAVKFPVKIIILGNHRSGKSSLLHFLLENNLDYDGDSTHILNIKSYNVEEGIPGALFFDFGGQDYYHGIYKVFLSKGSIYLLLWNKQTNANERKADSDKIPIQNFNLNYWLAQKNYHLINLNKPQQKASEEPLATDKLPKDVDTETKAPKPKVSEEHVSIDKVLKGSGEPVFIIQSHAEKGENADFQAIPVDKSVDNLFYASLRKGDYYETAQKDFFLNKNKNILDHLKLCLDELIELIRKERERNEPQWYIDFYKYILSKQGEESTTIDELLKIYTPKEKTEEDERRESLRTELKQFHSQGLILYYEKIDKVWLNPTSLVKHIHSNILKKELITEFKGRIPKEKFDKDKKTKDILSLLEEQKVIFEHEKKEYIIPNFLPLVKDNQAEYDLLTFGLTNPNFKLKFKNFLPIGLINQLICFFGSQPDTKKFWRDQFLFTFEGTYKVLININFELLEIKVFILSKDNDVTKAQTDHFTYYLFYVIMAMYRHFKPVAYKELLPDKSGVIKVGEWQRSQDEYLEIFKEEGTTPDDLYISLANDYWVKFTDLAKKKQSERVVVGYFSDGQKLIEKNDVPVKPFEVFTNKRFGSMKKLFISYSKFDEDYKNELIEHLINLKRENFVEVFDDRQLELGIEWDKVLKQKIDECDYFICLVSRHFLNVHYIYEEEIPRALKRGKKIIPIIIKPCDWINTPINIANSAHTSDKKLGDFNADKVKIIGLRSSYVNSKGQEEPMDFSETERDQMWLNVINQIKTLIKADS